MTPDWIYKIFARHNLDLTYYVIDAESRTNQDAQIEALKREFGGTWDIWVERYPREHPHAALQRRLTNCSVFGPKRFGRPKNNVVVVEEKDPAPEGDMAIVLPSENPAQPQPPVKSSHRAL